MSAHNESCSYNGFDHMGKWARRSYRDFDTKIRSERHTAIKGKKFDGPFMGLAISCIECPDI